MPIYRSVSREALIAVPLDLLSAVYHRSSGITHLLAAPAPEILAALAEPADLPGLRSRLAAEFDLDEDDGALVARLDELVAAGLITVS